MFFNLALTFYLQANLLLFPTVPSYMGLQIPYVFRWSDGRKKAGKPAVQSGNILFYLQIPGYICCHPRVVRLHLPSGHGSGDGVRFRDGSEQRISQSLRKFPVFHTKGQLFWHRCIFTADAGGVGAAVLYQIIGQSAGVRKGSTYYSLVVFFKLIVL